MPIPNTRLVVTGAPAIDREWDKLDRVRRDVRERARDLERELERELRALERETARSR